MIALLATLAAALAAPGDLVLRDARIVDARGEGPTADLLVHDGRIAAIGQVQAADDAEVLELDGATVVPGLIDTHVHISMAPGAAWRKPDPDPPRAQHLRAYLAFGVTTILDPGILVEDARQIRALAEEGPAPRVLFLGPFLGPTDGYVQVVMPAFPGVATPDDVAPLFDSFQDVDTVGAKVTFEDGPIRPIWPLHSDDVLAAMVDEAARRDRDLYAHAMTKPMWREALSIDPHAIVHGLDKPCRPLAEHVASRGIYVAPTLAVPGSALTEWHPEWLDAPEVLRAVPAEELATARDPDVHRAYREAMIDTLAPKLGVLRGLVLKMASSEGAIDKRLHRAERATEVLQEEGVPLVLGSDAGNWPILPFLLHGPSTHLEIALMHEAGLTPLQVLTAATRTPAEMLGLDDELGTVEVGKRADLVIVDGDPLQDLSVLRTPRWVVRDGEARTPEGWLTE